MFLIAGGYNDPNIQCLLRQANEHGISILPLLTEKEYSLPVSWDLDNHQFWIDNKLADVHAAFIRRDVFHDSGENGIYRASTWYSSICGWLACTPEVALLNRDYLGRITNKLQALFLARQLGLRIPETRISNQLERIEKQQGHLKIAKPVNGGGYCQEVAALMETTDHRGGQAACPAIVQQKISGPDIRIYRVGEQYFGFRIESNSLDYRQSKQRTISFLEHLPTSIVKKLGRLTDRMGLDWGAADFKQDVETNRYYFLEVNSNPMFSVFDRIGAGKISAAIFKHLS